MKVRFSELELDEMLDGIREEMVERFEAAVVKSAERIVTEGQVNLRRRQGTPDTPAPAGESPQQIEGDLLLSLKLLGKPRKTKYSVRQNYGSEHESAGLHEFGGTITQNGKKRIYPPRPYIRPAEAATEDEVRTILEEM